MAGREREERPPQRSASKVEPGGREFARGVAPVAGRPGLAKKLPPGSLLALQRTSGNAALAGLLGSKRPALAVQRAIGLEIEVPIPIDPLTLADVANIQADAKKNWALPHQHTKRVQYASLVHPAANGFRVEADKDDRVKTGAAGQPPHEGGQDSIMEIVFDPPAKDVVEFEKTIGHIKTFVQNVEALTTNMTKRAHDPWGTGVSVGPLEYPPAVNVRQAAHNWKGSVQVNVGIDAREYHSLLKWYAASSYATARRARATVPAPLANAAEQLFKEAQTHIVTAVDVGRTVTGLVEKGIPPAGVALTKKELADAGNLRGLRGWLTHIAFYLVRGTANFGGAAGTIKNLAPVLLKSPPEIVSDYGLTAEEIKIFNAQQQAILDEINGRVGRAGDVGQPANAIKVWPTRKTMLDTIVDLQGKAVPLTTGAIMNPTSVGPRRTGNAAVTAIKDVPGAAKGEERGGIVPEFRMIPGYFEGPAAWKTLGLDFLKAAIKRNRRSGTST